MTTDELLAEIERHQGLICVTSKELFRLARIVRAADEMADKANESLDYMDEGVAALSKTIRDYRKARDGDGK